MARDVPLHVYDRRELAPGLICWVFRYNNAKPVIRREALSTGLELAVQLEGRWGHQAEGGLRWMQAGETFLINPGDRYGYNYDSNAGPGLQVGFLLYPQEFAPGRIRSTDSLRLDPRSMTSAAEFVSLARELALAAFQQAPFPLAQAVDEFKHLLEKCELLHQDALLKVRSAIESDLSQQLYLRHLADQAQMLPDTFYRQFTRRFGVSPIRYRLLARLTHAARLTWQSPQLTVRGIAEAVGFDDVTYFHRTFRQHFGVSPAEYGQRKRLAKKKQVDALPDSASAGTPPSGGDERAE